ncbi:PRC-barrel domain-containing protein [Nostoc sp. 'Lobaria pulmonaria (5183) cyanobiont']|uniref:PRC-barrel domain-containing protein n=1 Tax=Nostoc sp. 'Lobaria pulmonaria (5183) cyanobiont' TaxID=1618022 RepID=UPI000CF31720|nr:PRC-barrel domain-containing protein [Nostoc sp. 'Lobaria pulmonaria (5183) cyanobiont']AVH70172.1 PRC-barrel domain-containing protein [Nostoc sp. 'Lobaria pulmonaria (5183) cyanobiont']
MRKGSDVIDKVVVTSDKGQKIQRIIDLIFDHKRNQLLGFLVEEKGLFGDAKVIPLQEVQAIGSDAIIVKSKESIVKAHRVPAIKEILHQNIVLRGTRILTTEGLYLGGLVDLFFDEHSGLVEGYEVSGGIFADAYSGRSFVPAPEALTIGDDVAFVPPETAQMMEEQVGGIRGAVQATEDRFQESAQTANRRLQSASQNAGEQLQSSVENVNRRLQSASQNAGEQIQSSVENVNRRLQSASQNAGEQLQAATDATSGKLQDLNRNAAASLTNNLVDPAEQKVYVIGKHVERDVLTPDGSVLLLQGQEVTLVDAEAASRMGILDELYRATGGSLTANISRNLQAATESTSNRIGSATMSSAANLRHSVNGLAAQAIQQVRGRRVLQTVRADDGLIIAASGQIVTESVLARAQSYGKQAELLNAAGLALATAVRSTTSDTWLETKVQLRQGASVAQENLNTFWQALKQKAEMLQRRSTRAMRKQRIEQALGRPVTRVILDPEDNVILNVGELITHCAVRQAEEGGVLNILLSSVYIKEPEISGQELRAQEHGMAALSHHDNGRSQLESKSILVN